MYFFKDILNSITGSSFNVSPIKEIQAIDPALKKASELSLLQLTQQESSEARSQELKRLGKQVLEKGKHWHSVPWRQFALMHNASIIRHTTFEGGQTSVSIKEWLLLLQLWQKDEGLFFSLQLSKKQIDLLISTLKNILALDALIPPLQDTPLSKSALERAVSSFLAELRSQLKKHQTAYLPMGYRHGVTNDGHAIPFQVVEEENSLVIYPLNLGNGASSHPVLDETTSQSLISFKFFPIRIPKEIFWGDLGHTAFCHLFRYMVDPPDPQYMLYEGEDLYDILLTLGELDPNLGKNPELYKAKGQRSGTCPEKGVKNIVHDLLITEQIPTVEIKKIFLNLYFCSLVAGYHTYRKNPTLQHAELLHNAAEELGLTLRKYKAHIPEEELLGAQAAIHEVKKASKCSIKTSEASLPSIVNVSDKSKEMSINTFSKEFPLITVDAPTVSSSSLKNKKTISSTTYPIKVPSFEVSCFPELLKEWVSYISTLSPQDAYLFLFDCAMTLPIPSWNEQDSWDQIPIDQIPSLLKNFELLVFSGLKDSPISRGHHREILSSSPFFSDQCLIIHTFYAIADRLARRCPHTQLKGFASPFCPLLFDMEIATFTSLPFGDENQRYAALSSYFSLCLKNAQFGAIFPIDDILPIEEFVYRSIHSNQNSNQGVNHVVYLRQFVIRHFKNASNSILTPLYLSIWIDEKKAFLPEEVHSLYYFAYLSYCLFQNPSSPFPQQLLFSEGKDDKGKQALCIKTLEKKPISLISLSKLKKAENCIDGERFKELGIDPSYTIFENIHAKKMGRITTNDAVCMRLKKSDVYIYKISESVYRDLLRITRNDNLKVPLALQWASSHLFQLEHQGVQHIIDHCLFAPGLLQERLKNEPTTIHAAREVIEKGLLAFRCNIHHIHTLLFFIRTGVLIETHVSHLYGKKESETSLKEYNKTLSKLLLLPLQEEFQTEVIALKALITTLTENPTFEETVSVLQACFLLQEKTTYQKSPSILKKIGRFLRAFILKIQDVFLDPKSCNLICHTIIKTMMKTSVIPPDEKWEGVFPVFSCQNVTLNFLHYSIQGKESGLLTKLSLDRFKYLGIENLEKTHGNEFWKNEDQTLVSLDGKLQISVEGFNSVIKREIILNGQKKWCLVQHFSRQAFESSHLKFFSSHPQLQFIHYAPLKKEKGDPDLIVFEASQDIPFFRIDYSSNNQMLITQVDPEGKPLSICAANLGTIKSKDHTLYKAALRLARPEEVMCLIHTETKMIEELYFCLLSLQFRNSGQGLESSKYPGFFFLPEVTLEALNHYESAFVLHSSSEGFKILIPAKTLTVSGEDFSKTVLPGKDFIVENPSYYEFTLCPSDGTLVSRLPEAYLYLCFLFKMQRDFDKALLYLQKAASIKEFTCTELSILKEFKEIKDRSPSSLAFNMKLLLVMIENIQVLREGRFEKSTSFSSGEIYLFLRWGNHVYTDYLQTISQENLSAIPAHLRITIEQEKNVLYMLNAFAAIEKTTLSPLLNARYTLLFSKNKKMARTRTPLSVSIRPSAYASSGSIGQLDLGSSITPFGQIREKNAYSWETLSYEPYPIRFTSGAVEMHFITLYEQARACPKGKLHSFDFTVLALLKVKYSGHCPHQYPNGENLGRLLFYVRHFPEEFADLPLQSLKDGKEIRSRYKEIVNRFLALENKDSFIAFSKTFLKASKEFNYTKRTIVEIPKLSSEPEMIVFHLSHFEKTPFRPICEGLFIKTVQPLSLPATPPFKEESLIPQAKTIGGELYQSALEGYEQLKKKTYASYTLQADQLEHAKKTLFAQKKTLDLQLVEKRKAIIQFANSPYRNKHGPLSSQQLQDELDFRLSKDSRQAVKLLPETIMKEAILKNDASFLVRCNPLLEKADREKLITEVNEYYHELTMRKIVNDALKLIEKIQKNPTDELSKKELAHLLDYEFLYDPQEYSEISYFTLMTGKVLREEQIKTYLWLCEGFRKKENRLFQLAAGGGKTSVLIPLLILRAKKEKLMPVVFSTQAIYSIDKENLSTTLLECAEMLSLLEVGMHMKLSLEDLQTIYEQLTYDYSQGKTLLITPQIYYSLLLFYRYAGIVEKDEGKVKWLSLILDFFQNRCLQLIDESHKNLDPLTRSIFGIGEFFPLPTEEALLFQEMMKPLLGAIEVKRPDGKSLSTLSRMKENLLGNPSEKEVQAIQETLASYLSSSPLLEIPESKRNEFIYYWTHKEASPPSFLKELRKINAPQAHLIALVSYFILDSLPQLVKLRTEFDHRPSIYPEEEFDTPAHHKTPSTAQFEDPYRALAVSIKGTYHRGLFSSQVHHLIEILIKQDWQEQSHILPNEDTPAIKTFKSWVTGSSFNDLHLRDISLSNSIQMNELVAFLTKHPAALDYYLLNVILPQVGYSPSQLVCTPAHLLYGFHLSAAFSATPLHPHVYPRAIKDFRLDPLFEAHVLSELSQEKNLQKLYVTGTLHFFKEMKEGKDLRFQKAQVLIDPSGFFDLSNEEIAHLWLESSPQLDGVLYYKEGLSLQVDREEKICLLQRDQKTPLEFNGSEIERAFEEHHLKWDTLNLGTYYDAAHTESANILQKVNAKAFIFPGDNLTSSRLVQAIMRMRGFLDPAKNQTLTWVFQEDLANKIPKGTKGELEGAQIFAWCNKNEEEDLKKRVILCAFQEISFRIEQIALTELQSHLHAPEQQIVLFEKYQKGFAEYTKHDPYALFADHGYEEKCESVLWNFAKQHYARFGYSLPLEKNTSLKKDILVIVGEVQEKIQTISINFTKKVSKEIEQQCRIKRETEQLEYRPRPFDPISAEGIYGKLSLEDPLYPLHRGISSQIVFHSKNLTPRLYFEKNQLLTAKNAGFSLEQNFLKPIDFFLIISYYDETWAEAISNDIISTYLKRLTDCPATTPLLHKAFLVTAEGKLCQKGCGALAPSDEEVNRILNSCWLKDLVIDAALLRGDIRHPDRFLERLKEWDDFQIFWKKIVDALPNPETANHTALSKLVGKSLTNYDNLQKIHNKVVVKNKDRL